MLTSLPPSPNLAYPRQKSLQQSLAGHLSSWKPFTHKSALNLDRRQANIFKAQAGQGDVGNQRFQRKTSHPVVIQNPISQPRLQKMLKELAKYQKDGTGFSELSQTEAAKKLVMLGNHFLTVKEELAKDPSSHGAYRYQPNRLVVYRELSEAEQERPTSPPGVEIVRQVDDLDSSHRWQQRPWRALADTTDAVAKEEPFWSPMRPINAVTQALAFLSTPDLFNIVKKAGGVAKTLHNHTQGMGLMAWTGEERQKLADTAFYNGFHVERTDELADYVERIFNMLVDAQHALSEAQMERKSGVAKLGIAYRMPNGREAILDLTDQFPGGNLTAMRKPTPQDVEGLEKAFRKNT